MWWAYLGLGAIIAYCAKKVYDGLNPGSPSTPVTPPGAAPAPAPVPVPDPVLEPFNVWAPVMIRNANRLALSTDCTEIMKFWWETKATYDRYAASAVQAFSGLNNELVDAMIALHKQIEKVCSEAQVPGPF